MMTQQEWDRLGGELKSGKTTAQEAIALLMSKGDERHEAWEDVFIILGGDDIIEENAEGVRCYRRSGKPVDDVLAKMRQ